MRKAFLIVGLASLLIVIACNSSTGPSAGSSSNWWPMAVGNSWTFQYEDSEYGTLTILETGIDMSFGTNLSLMIDDQDEVADTMYVENNDNYIRLWYFDEYEDSTWCYQTMLDLPLVIGKTWTPFGGDATMECVSLNETVTVPAGTFENCAKIKLSEGSYVDYYYYAQGVGFVFASAEYSSEWYMKLFSYTVN